MYSLKPLPVIALLIASCGIAHAASVSSESPAYTYAALNTQRPGVVDVKTGIQHVLGPTTARLASAGAARDEKPVLELVRPEPTPPALHRLELVGFGDNQSELTRVQEQLISARLPEIQHAAHVKLVGHTDARGSDAFNDALGTRRAAAVRAALDGQSVAVESADSLGEKLPIADNESAVGRALNRRVTLEYLK